MQLRSKTVAILLTAALYGASKSATESRQSTQPGTLQPPKQAAAVGYLLHTYSASFTKSTVDMRKAEIRGFQWYPFHFFGFTLTSPTGLIFNTDGSLTLGASTGESLVTAAPSSSKDRWIGNTFGGGAYFEAELKFDPQNTIGHKVTAWPSFWSMAIEHLANLPGEQWVGAPQGYAHFIEADFFEYDVWSFSPHSYYGGALHDWFGIYQQTCRDRFCDVSNAGGGKTVYTNFVVQTPPETDFRRYHKVGFLWVPATDSTPGYGQYFFDGQPTNDRVSWSKFKNQAPPPGLAPWTFGVLDQQHLALIIETGPGEPMTVRAIDVWQASTANNIVH